MSATSIQPHENICQPFSGKIIKCFLRIQEPARHHQGSIGRHVKVSPGRPVYVDNRFFEVPHKEAPWDAPAAAQSPKYNNADVVLPCPGGALMQAPSFLFTISLIRMIWL